MINFSVSLNPKLITPQAYVFEVIDLAEVLASYVSSPSTEQSQVTYDTLEQ